MTGPTRNPDDEPPGDEFPGEGPSRDDAPGDDASRDEQPGDEPAGDEPTGDEDIVRIEFTDELDLHPFHPRDVADLVKDYLDLAAAQRWEGVRIIHGKGIGAMRETVHRVLAAHPAVAHFALASDRAGWGATVVTLKAG